MNKRARIWLPLVVIGLCFLLSGVSWSAPVGDPWIQPSGEQITTGNIGNVADNAKKDEKPVSKSPLEYAPSPNARDPFVPITETTVKKNLTENQGGKMPEAPVDKGEKKLATLPAGQQKDNTEMKTTHTVKELPGVTVTGIAKIGPYYWAIIQDAGGSGYIIGEGSQLGNYRVTSITSDRVTIALDGYKAVLKLQKEK